MKNKISWKFFVVFASILIISGGVWAFYTFTYDKDLTYQVVGSQANLIIVVDLTNEIFNVSDSLTTTQNLSLLNENGAANMSYIIITNVTNLDPGNCTIIPEEVSFNLTHANNVKIDNNTFFTMNPGLNNFNFTAIAINNKVCPQNITNVLNFTEI